MARASRRKSEVSAAKSTPLKRGASPATPQRQSKRIKSSSNTPNGVTLTPKKSVYFEHSSDTESLESANESEASGYEDEDASATEPDPSSEDEVSSDDEPSTKRKPKKSTKASPATKAKIKVTAGKELWREGVKLDVEPGQEVYVELPKARSAGKIPYKDHTIHPNTLLFLADLKANNERAWLKTHDADFRQSERDWKSFVEILSEKLMDVDETVPELPVKDVVFRIYRDIRFSPDPTPYKAHFSVAWSRTGRKGPYAAYYLQISKNHSFFGGGLWMPPKEPLALLRRAVDRKPEKLKEILMKEGMRKSFLGGIGKDEKKAVKAFCNANKESALKKRPKDYDASHPEIEILKLKSYTVGCKLKDDDILAKDSVDRILTLMRNIEPWITYLNSVVMPDANPDADDSDSNDDDGNDGNDEDSNDNSSGSEDGLDGADDEDPGPDPDEPEDWEPQ